MKKTISKFDDIVFPFFGLLHKPYKIIYDVDTIRVIKKSDSIIQTLDNKNLQGDYFARLLQLENRITFDYTCKNLQEVILSGVKWGLDSNATPFDFTKKEAVPVKIVRVKAIKGTLVWLESISYPFRVQTNEQLDISDDIFAKIIKIKNDWYIKKFIYDKQDTNRIEYI
jgi:hypothetical protein